MTQPETNAENPKSCQELMLELSDINRRLNGLIAEWEALHKQLVGLKDTELSQAAQTTLENIDQLKGDVMTDHKILDDRLNGAPPAGGKDR